MFPVKLYSYLKALKVFILDIFIAGIIEAIAEINNENLKKIKKIESREQAIKSSIDIIKPHDILLIAGKGHENYQIIGEKKILFSDKNIALKYLLKK